MRHGFSRAIIAAAFLLAAAPAFAGNIGGPQADVRKQAQSLALASTSNTIAQLINNGQGIASIEVSGLTGSGATLIIEVQGAAGTGGTWSTKKCGAALVSTMTADGKLICEVSGDTQIRLRPSVAGSGTATVSINLSSQVGLAGWTKPAVSGFLDPSGNQVPDSAVNPHPVTDAAVAASAASLDTKATAGNTSAASTATNTGNTAASAASIDGKATTGNTNTGNTAASAASIDSKMTTANAALAAIQTNTAAVPFSAAATATVTRPSNTTPYPTNSAWTNSTTSPTYLTFAGMCASNGATTFLNHLRGRLHSNQAGVKPMGILHIYKIAPTAQNDGAAWNDSASVGNEVVAIPFNFNLTPPTSASDTTDDESIAWHVTCAPGDTALYGETEITNPATALYTPLSGEVLDWSPTGEGG